jgi:hypothetical protein
MAMLILRQRFGISPEDLPDPEEAWKAVRLCIEELSDIVASQMPHVCLAGVQPFSRQLAPSVCRWIVVGFQIFTQHVELGGFRGLSKEIK